MSLICYTSQLEPKNVEEVLGDEYWTIALQKELNQFTRNDVWYLVPRPKDKHFIGTKWILKNKQNGNGVIIRNKQDWLPKDTQRFRGLIMKTHLHL